MKRTDLAKWLWPAAGGALAVAAWYAVRHATGLSSWILPTPHEILAAGWHERARLLPAAGHTARDALLGFGAAAAAGFGLALLLGWAQWVRATFYPWLLMLQMTPVVIVAPIIVLWAGPGLPGIVTVTFLISFFPIVVNTTHGLVSADPHMVDLFRMCNATRAQELWLLRVPAAMPHYLTGLRIAATLAPLGAIFGEYLVGNAAGGTGGLGFLVYSFTSQIKVSALFATAATGCLLGFGFTGAVALIYRRVLRHWHDSIERADR